MMKILCILLPHFALTCELNRRPGLEGRPVVVFAPGPGTGRVLDFPPELDDLKPGMPLEQAIALHGQVEIISADSPHYREVFEQILDNLQRVSPMVEGAGAGTAYMSTEGLELLYPETGQLTGAVRAAMPAGFEVKLGMADGKFPAYLAAGRSRPGECKNLEGNPRPFLKNIPCAELPVSVRSRAKLDAFGLKTLGQAAAVAPAAMEAQFGPEGRLIHHLAAGIDETPLVPRPPREVITRSLELESATALTEVLLAGFERLFLGIFSLLAPKNMGLSRADIWTRALNGECREKSVFFKTPPMEAATALRRISQVMETWPQPGPVETLGIRATGLGRPGARQKSLLPEVRSAAHLLGEISQLELKLGGPQLFKFKEVEPWSRIPERRHVLTPLSR